MIYAVTGEIEAIAAAQTVPDWGLVSIVDDPDDGETRGHRVVPWEHEHRGPVLSLAFDDVDRMTDDLVRRGYHPPRREHASAIVTFAREALVSVPGVLVHCAAGISRSTAAVCGIVAALEGPQPAIHQLGLAVQHAYDQGWRTERGIRPNIRLLALLDLELVLGWDLVRIALEHFHYKRDLDAIIQDALEPE